MTDPTFHKWLESTMSFGDCLTTLPVQEREEVVCVVETLRDRGHANPEALVRADYHSSYAEVTRYEALETACEQAESLWLLNPDG